MSVRSARLLLRELLVHQRRGSSAQRRRCLRVAAMCRLPLWIPGFLCIWAPRLRCRNSVLPCGRPLP